MTNQPVLLSEALAGRAMADAAFYERLPEYMALRVKMQVMKADLTAPTRGCSGCRRRRVVGTLFSDFAAITLALSADGLARLKAYLGVPSILVNHMNPSTGAVVVRTI